MWGVISTIVTWFLGRLTASKESSVADLAADKANAQTRLAAQETTNAIVVDAARTRADADARVLRDIQQPAPEGSAPGAHTALDANPAGHWRD